MKRKYFLLVLFFILAIFFIINTSSNAIMYKILDSEGNVIRLTNNPKLSIKEKEAGYTISPPPGGSIESIQDQIVNEQEVKQQVPSGSEKYDFRKTNWGMSKEEAKATEDKKPSNEDDTIIIYENVEIIGRNFFCSYHFMQNKLYSSHYSIGTILGEVHTNKNDYIDDYESLKKLITKKYGKPEKDAVIWKNDLFKNNKQDWGTAISIGHLSYAALWETPTTEIGVALGGNNYEIWLSVGYDSKKLREWAKQLKEKETLKNF